MSTDVNELVLDLSPEGSEAICVKLLELASGVVDLRFCTVRDAALKLGIQTEQLNHILKRDLKKVKFETLIILSKVTNVELKFTLVEIDEIPEQGDAQ